ncbi:hypothetical protein Tco_0484337 [Tanacetum coccineum]
MVSRKMRHEQQLVDYKIKEITNDLGIIRFRGEKIDEEYERICEITIRKLEQDFNEWWCEIQKKEQAYEEEQYSAARRRMLSIPFVDEDDYIPLGDIIARYSTESDVPSDEKSCPTFTTFSNPLFDSNDDFSSDDESLSEEEIQKDEFKYFSNPLYDLDDEIITNEKIIPNQKNLDVVIPILPGINEHCFNAESDLLKSLLNHDSPIDSIKIDSIFDEYSLPRLRRLNMNILMLKRVLSPSLSPLRIVTLLWRRIEYFARAQMIQHHGCEKKVRYDLEGDILLLEELLNDDFVPLAEYHHFTLDFEPDTAVKDDFDELNEDECFDPGGGENVVFLNVEEDDSFTFTSYFSPFVHLPEAFFLIPPPK